MPGGGRAAMMKRKAAQKQAATTSTNNKATKTKTIKKKLSLEELIEEGEKYAQEYKLDMAVKSFKEALSIDTNNTLLMDTIGELMLELGELKQAKQYFTKSIETNPNDSSSKYMNLGQLLGGADAIRCYTKGIEIMETELKELIAGAPQQVVATTQQKQKEQQQAQQQQTKNQLQQNNKNKKTKDGRLVEDQRIDIGDDQDEEEMLDDDEEDGEVDQVFILKDQICSALCSLAELYLTDECFDEEAEVKCETHLRKAIEYTPMSPEPYSLLASMKISQVKNDDALDLLNHSYSLWSSLEVDQRPSLEYRYGIAQMFVELDQCRTAVDILETLVYEQDNIAEIWHTLGVVYDRLKEPRSALECLESAAQLLSIAHDGMDEELQAQIDSLLPKVQKDVELLPPEEDDDEEDEDMEE
ncbi:hypothetical protein SAMD00019534_019960 [Acytostelium subglobosum LB1]|uniref:hypothetical protein n=1 Tax=Acytostelium subglobosum LB1 TaxID=1410327 RepID=UPI000644B14B|nr:hypothetical protein SAMD00019534_019960 [Acytostelium subglobosum LB1]GAM18821.1 hypothetical protein SAMD00019534_019960 [Acytostelium subglobosum LB1]|eukprot:XP_012758041.1 hypothetical protein SAMD00019534_019960 [Acytostelium subglobosum LB1]